MRALADALIGALLAPLCACCRAPLRSPTTGAVCATCWEAIPQALGPQCDLCGDVLPSWRHLSPSRRCNRCERTARVITIGRSIGPYEGTLREIIQAFKYAGRRSLAKPLAQYMVEAGADALAGADAVVPVPLHVLKEYSRGFNQSADLATHLGLDVIPALRRTRATVTQTDLPEWKRHENVAGAFALRRQVPRDSVLVIVDDVSTTGATLDACGRVLLEAGAREVRGLTAARAAARLR